MSNNPHDPIVEIVTDQLRQNNPHMFAALSSAGELQAFVERLSLEIGDHCDDLIARGAEPGEAKAHALADLLPEPETHENHDLGLRSPWCDVLGVSESEFEELCEREPWMSSTPPMPAGVASVVLDHLRGEETVVGRETGQPGGEHAERERAGNQPRPAFIHDGSGRRFTLWQSLSKSRQIGKAGRALSRPVSVAELVKEARASMGGGKQSRNVRRRERALDTVFKIALENPSVAPVTMHYGLDREKLQKLYDDLIRYAARFEGGHWVPASTLCFAHTLDFAIRVFWLPGCSHDQKLKAGFMLCECFRTGRDAEILAGQV